MCKRVPNSNNTSRSCTRFHFPYTELLPRSHSHCPFRPRAFRRLPWFPQHQQLPLSPSRCLCRPNSMASSVAALRDLHSSPQALPLVAQKHPRGSPTKVSGLRCSPHRPHSVSFRPAALSQGLPEALHWGRGPFHLPQPDALPLTLGF
eukprot:RCo046272